MASTGSPTAPLWPAPVMRQQGLYVLHVVTWDLHAARGLCARLLAAGVSREQVRMRGRRCEDGLQEAQVRHWRRLSTRWRKNIFVAVVSAVLVGIPVGASTATVILGETPAAAWTGGMLGGLILLVLGTTAVWADHFQRSPASQNRSRVEGHVCVSGAVEIVRAEMLVATTEDVMAVERLPFDADPLTWA